MSHSAMSTAPIARIVATRARAHSSRLSRSRSSGFWSIRIGFRKRIRPGPSRLAGFDEVRSYAGSWEEWGNREESPIETP